MIKLSDVLDLTKYPVLHREKPTQGVEVLFRDGGANITYVSYVTGSPPIECFYTFLTSDRENNRREAVKNILEGLQEGVL